jgi:hypothetical protein
VGATGATGATGPSALTTKGDLATFSTTVDRLPAGANGESLVVDSATSTGLRWQPTVVGGKNFLINGLFDIWQRSTDNTTSTSMGTFYAAADRWQTWVGTSCNSRYQRISDADPLYSQYSYRIQRVAGVTTATNYQLSQNIETPMAKLLVGRTVTLSFRVKKGANWSDPNGAGAATIYYNNNVDGNCITQAVTNGGSVAFSPTTSFATYTLTATIPSSGVNSIMVNFAWDVTGTAGADDWLEFSAVQLEVGSVATAFSRAGGTLQGELAACQRYYWRRTTFQIAGGTQSVFDNTVWFPLNSFNAVPMRAQPTVAIESTPYITGFAANDRTITSVTISSQQILGLVYDSTKLTSNTSWGANFNDAGRALSFSSEL